MHRPSILNRLSICRYGYPLLALVLLLGCVNSGRSADDDLRTAGGFELLGITTFRTGTTFADTEVGGLSAITYDAENDLYYILSDDRSEHAPARFYIARIDLGDGRLDEGDVEWLAVTTLLDATGQPFADGYIDPEGIALSERGSLYISSEGNPNVEPPALPAVLEFDLSGRQLGELLLPDKFLPDSAHSRGVRNNGGFEGLSLQPDGRYLYAALEESLSQDGPTAGRDQGSLSRILQFDLETAEAGAEYVYLVEPIPGTIIPPGSNNGLSELLALDNRGTFLVLERSYAVGIGNTIRLYEATAERALDVRRLERLRWSDEGVPEETNPPVPKALLLDLTDLAIVPDNVEGMTLGPVLEDGRQALILVSDNNFNPLQTTQLIALALTLE